MLMMGIMLIGVFNVFLPVETCVASGNIIYVDDSGGANYTNIQDAINVANESDTIYVYSGTYNENIVITKTLTLTGIDGRGSTTINGDDAYKHTIKVEANNVNISGFTIQNVEGKGQQYACVFLNSVANCRITNNIIKKGRNGVYLVGSSGNTISGNTAENNDAHGISLTQSVGNTIQNNILQNNVQNGIYLSLSSQSNEIYQNSITGNQQYGMSMVSSSNNNILHHNDFVDNYGNANDPCTNTWDDGSEGNKWDDYTGKDENKDGIGDVGYNIPSGSNQDRYPLGYFVSENQEPVAYIDSISPSPTTQGQTVNFNGHGMDDGTIIEWEWSSSKDGVLSISEDFSSSSLSVGTHTIKFRVKDDDDKWSEYAERTLTINPPESPENQKPIATIIKPSPTTTTTATSGESVYFHGIGTDSDGTIVEYIWRSSKDGVFNENSTFTKSDLSVGTHAIYFKVKDNQGEWSSEDTAILVINTSSSPSNEPPTPDTGGPYTGYANASMSFDASNSSDPDGDDIVSYEWDFGDGANGNGVSVEHTYSSIGNYTVTLTVTDNQDKTSTISTYANIVVQTTVQPPDQNDDNGDDTPGFEIFMAIIAISLILFWKRRK